MRRWYGHTVDHYLRLAVRDIDPTDETARRWQTVMRDWLAELDKGDREFLGAVFADGYRTTDDGLTAYPGYIDENWKRFKQLEREAARRLGLIGKKAV